MPDAAESSHLPGLERALPYHHKEWVFQRLGWALLALFLTAAGTGLLGPGGVFAGSSGPDAFRVSFDRFGRREAALGFTAACRPPAGGRTLRLAFSEACLRDAEIQWMRPQPDTSVAVEHGGLTYVFRRDPDAEEIEIAWSLKPQFAGTRACHIATEGAYADFRQWIWP
ncbi:MAG: hypothetical protein JF616_16845 [Fibrobacteres bacterium]|jgi:hypothetical protein|nr:hypothetical protein [Fibrobacterota bacterium]